MGDAQGVRGGVEGGAGGGGGGGAWVCGGGGGVWVGGGCLCVSGRYCRGERATLRTPPEPQAGASC